MLLSAILFIVATILALLACFNVASPRFSLGWGAIACIALGMALNSGILR